MVAVLSELTEEESDITNQTQMEVQALCVKGITVVVILN